MSLSIQRATANNKQSVYNVCTAFILTAHLYNDITLTALAIIQNSSLYFIFSFFFVRLTWKIRKAKTFATTQNQCFINCNSTSIHSARSHENGRMPKMKRAVACSFMFQRRIENWLVPLWAMKLPWIRLEFRINFTKFGADWSNEMNRRSV